MITDGDNNFLYGAYMRRITNYMFLMMDAALEHKNVTHQQGKILCYINDKSTVRDVFQNELEEVFQIRRSSITSLLNNLEKKELILRESCPEDRRIKKLILTPTSQKSIPEIKQVLKSIENKLVEGMSDDEKDMFANLLQRGLENLENQTS
ncbi:MAG: MarR family transcriptional regulator [Lachnospiraceae bacterium]|nr:MarR family transcriptional regulator [Lachnospiraceae bacterium]